MRVITVEVHEDHLERLTKTKPLRAVAELIWNGLDAEATRVEIRLERGHLGALDRLRVVDNGHGMPLSDIEASFAGLGGSWKRLRDKSRNDLRLLHGKEGLGRFRAFTLGSRVMWSSIADTPDGRARVEVTGTAANPGTFRVSEPEHVSTELATGTMVVIDAHDEGTGGLLTDGFIARLTVVLTPYLMLYPDVEVVYDGKRLDPGTIVDRSSTYELELDVPAELTIIEWTAPLDRALVVCDAEGFAIEELSAGIQAPGYDFTAYVKSEAFAELGSDIAVGELHPVVEPGRGGGSRRHA